jgi:hypothetical protein
VFATLFTYGSDGRPKWYVASEMRAIGLGSGGREPSFEGALFETTGPTSAANFDPARVTRRQVGTIRFVASFTTQGSVTYTVDGLTVSKGVIRQAWAASDISGQFNGTRVLLGFNCPPAVPVSERLGPMTVTQSGSAITITTAGGIPATTCTYSGTLSQRGRMGIIESGSFSCNSGTTGGFRMEEIEVNPHVFSAHIASFANGCQARGHFGGVRATVVPPPD